MKFLLCLFLSGCGTYVGKDRLVTFGDVQGEMEWTGGPRPHFYARGLIHSKPTEAATTGIAKIGVVAAPFIPTGL